MAPQTSGEATLAGGATHSTAADELFYMHVVSFYR